MRVKVARPVSSRPSFKITKHGKPGTRLRSVKFAKGAIRTAKFLKRNF